jgi:hypothetical protein
MATDSILMMLMEVGSNKMTELDFGELREK